MIRQEWKGTINGKEQGNEEEGRKAKQKYCLWTSLEAHVVNKILYSAQECVHAWAEISTTSYKKIAEVSIVLHRLPCTPTDAEWQFVPSSMGGALTLSNPFSPKVHSRLENGGEKTRKKQGVGQRRKRAEGRKPAYLKKWNTYPTVEWRYDNLNFITFFLV